MSPYILWLAFGVACFVIEALVVSGVGFLFAGLGALTAGSILTAMPETTSLQQWVAFFVASGLWALFLWKPLQKFYGKTKNDGYKNIVGDTAYIAANGLKKGETGEATWSGTIMKARLADDANVNELTGSTQVVIHAVAGNVLIVKPR